MYTCNTLTRRGKGELAKQKDHQIHVNHVSMDVKQWSKMDVNVCVAFIAAIDNENKSLRRKLERKIWDLRGLTNYLRSRERESGCYYYRIS